MSEIVLAIVEAIGVGIAVHAWDVGNVEMSLGGIVFSLLFLMWAIASVAKEISSHDE